MLSRLRWLLHETGATVLLLVRSLLRRGPKGSFSLQLQDLLVRTVPLSVASMAFVGAVAIVDGGKQIQRLFGDPGGMGPTILELVVREFGPAFGGVIAATRIGSGIAAELAAMKVSEQIDALEMSAADPIAELVSPRSQAAFVALLVLGFLSTVAAAWTGAFAAALAFGSRPGAFLDTSYIDSGDIAVAVVKLALFGLAIPAVAARAGLVASGGVPGVGWATTRGVVASIVAVVVIDLLVGGVALALGI